MDKKVNAAVVQAAPILFDKSKTIDKALLLIEEAASKGSNLILFPESFIPAYPRGLSFGTVIGSRSEDGKELWKLYWENALSLTDPEIQRLYDAAKKHNVFLSIGITEKDSQHSGGTLFCTQLYISDEGKLLGLHRKIKPTGTERLIWGEGDGSTLTVVNTNLGKVGGLICWENYMPLARYSIYEQGVDIYLAPTADTREVWQSTLKHIACEGRCFVLGCNQFVTKGMYPPDMPGYKDLESQPEIMCRGGSVIIDPTGNVLAGPIWDKEEILYAELDISLVVKGKMDFDVVGHYNRPDIFNLSINRNKLDV